MMPPSELITDQGALALFASFALAMVAAFGTVSVLAVRLLVRFLKEEREQRDGLTREVAGIVKDNTQATRDQVRILDRVADRLDDLSK